jgi:hypothetical protein
MGIVSNVPHTEEIRQIVTLMKALSQSKGYEIFDPYHGRPLKIVRFRWQARLICWYFRSLDYWPHDAS